MPLPLSFSIVAFRSACSRSAFSFFVSFFLGLSALPPAFAPLAGFGDGGFGDGGFVACCCSSGGRGNLGTSGSGAGAEEVEEQTEFDVIISEIDGSKKIAAIKIVRQLTPLGLKEAKDAVTELPNTLMTGVTKEDAEDAKKKLEETGCKVEIK